MTSTALDAIHSRSILAGYNPATLFGASVLVVGAGALGQNLLIDLALAGIGEILIVDPDRFEAHNATRSPLYPTMVERWRWGYEKALVAARRLRRMVTAPQALIRYAVAPLQAIGDLPIGHVDAVFAAVDNLAGRAYLAERCRLLRRPLFEAGFHGAEGNLTVFGAEPEDACYRCLNPERTGAFSCTRYALETEAATAIPAIQNSAAALAAFVAEQAILWLHGAAPLRNRRAFLDLRAPSIEAVGLVADPDCPGVHWGMQPATADQSQIVEAGPAEPLARLLTIVRERYGRAEVRLPAPLVLRIACPGCGELTEPRTPEWRWLTTPRCEGCGGPFPQAEQQRAPSGIERLDVDLEDEVAALSCGAAGLPAGASFEVYPYEGQPLLLRLPGTIEQMMQIV